MTTYYVRTPGNGGNDGADGSAATPWATLSKALSTVSLAGGHTILMGNGTYQENTSANGYLLVQRAFADWVIVMPENGVFGDVTISGTNHTTYNLRFDNSSYIRLRWLKIVSAVVLTAGTNGLLSLTGTFDHYSFENLVMTVTSSNTVTEQGFICEIGGTSVRTDITFDSCIIRQTGGFVIHGLRFDKTAAGATLSGITVKNCDINIVGYALYAYGVTDLLVDGGSYIGTTYGIITGVDGASTQTTIGIIRNTYAKASGAGGHALLVGASCSAMQVFNNSVDGSAGDQGLVVKNNNGTILTNNTILGGALNGLYFKGATNAVATYNTVRSAAGNAMKVGVESGTGNKCQNINFAHNRLIGTGVAGLLSWGPAADDLGGGICDYNLYSPLGSARLGLVRADASVLNYAELRAAWVGYGAGKNDLHSRILRDGSIAKAVRAMG